MDLLNVIAVLVTLSAVLAWVNQRFLRLPTTIGLMVLAMVHALGVLALGRFVPGVQVWTADFIGAIDFDQTLLQGMLGYLLFAGALHVNINDLRGQGWVVGLLATIGVLVSTAVVGVGMFFLLPWLGMEMPLLHCLLFGSLIAPTDPIAVLAILGRLGAPKSLETKIAGESLFNDGVGVVVFLALLGFAGSGGHGEAPVDAGDAAGRVLLLFAEEAIGGAVFGLALGMLGFVLLRSINDHKTEVLITLAMVTGGYALASQWHLSGPIAMVVAGLLIGNRGRRLAMSQQTREHLDRFWELVDEILNAVLFVLIGLEVLVLSLDGRSLLAGLVAVPLALAVRLANVGATVWTLRRVTGRSFTPHATKVMTWAGLRGGISVALALSLKDQVQGTGAGPAAWAEAILTMTYVVVGFSIVVQGLTVGPLLRACGLAGGAAAHPHG